MTTVCRQNSFNGLALKIVSALVTQLVWLDHLFITPIYY